MIPAYVERRIAELADLQLYWPRTAIVDVIKPTGFGAGGLYSDHNAGTRKVHVNDEQGEGEYDVEVPHEYYPVLARVLVTHQCYWVRPGDVVRMTAMNYEDVEMPDGRTFSVMYERCMLAVIDGFDAAAIQLTEAAA